MKFISWTSGWKTYATVLVGIGTGIWQYFEPTHPIPSYVEWGLAFLGLGTARMAIAGQSKQTAQDIGILVQQVLAQVTVPATITVTHGDSTTTVAPTPTVTTETVTTESSGHSPLSNSIASGQKVYQETKQNLAPGKI